LARYRLPVFALLASLALPGAASAQQALLTHSVWFLRTAEKFPDKRIYRRYAVTPTGDMPNVELYNCPRDPDTFIHISFEMRKVRDLKDDFPSTFQKIEGRFLVDETNAFSLPGELIKSEMFFDRTPETAKHFDRVAAAKDLILLFGSGNSAVKYLRTSELSRKIPEFFTAANVGPMKPFTSAEVLQDCIRYRSGR
jgi:hypothetical protein